ncbi:histone-lysine N-methyltransferase, H3 lysine-9 specific SUVH6-like [Syzygium oleosum]|uniref:histone-lysine N-methyltransferase, H3 lysine-9 specific SUVH6-like n=1 Tax=Syzygium oleosum TaxID=219896 RepID=UPI0024BB4B50|nr:histone-lysine N-methyltransferase, H3 lysine-9 specific SUVH6-like [Syzygium oleosum]
MCSIYKMNRDSRPGKYFLTRRDFPPGCGSHARANVSHNDRHDSARERVIATLELFRDICHKLFREKSEASKESATIRRIDLHAAKEVKKKMGYVHGAKRFIGDVPGVEAGDKFHYRIELAVVGLHRPPRGGIDYMGPHPEILATSVVASRDYADDLRNPDELVYLGQGGMPGRDKKAEDQKLTRGNLALANSMKRNKPVRVIRKDRDHTFTYDGLYAVDRCREIRRATGKTVFEFVMKRLPGQPETLQEKKKMEVLESSG